MDLEKEIVKKMLEKNQNALVEFVNMYGKLVYFLLSKSLVEPSEKDYIDDCYNEVLSTVWFNIDCYIPEKGSLKSWIIGITKFKAMEAKRKNRKLDNEKKIVKTQMEQLNLYDRMEQVEVNTLLSNLEEKDKLIFIKRYIEGFTIQEIAEELSVSSDYIYNRISRGKKKIRNSFRGDLNGS